MPQYPALQIDHADHDLVLALVDDYAPTAAEEIGQSLRVFFHTAIQRDDAATAVARAMPGAAVIAREVDDEDWARRSQSSLTPIRVGAITIASPHSPVPSLESIAPTPQSPAPSPESPAASPHPLLILIQPSMGFGTGHHATTRLCLAALQTLDLLGISALDVGTGSGVLAIAARRLGAARALGVDADPDAIQSARENLPFNPEADQVTFEVRELGRDALPAADLVLANLTGGLLCRSARALVDLVHRGGHLIVSGLMKDERDDVRAAFDELDLSWEAHEDEWACLCLCRRSADTSRMTP